MTDVIITAFKADGTLWGREDRSADVAACADSTPGRAEEVADVLTQYATQLSTSLSTNRTGTLITLNRVGLDVAKVCRHLPDAQARRVSTRLRSLIWKAQLDSISVDADQATAIPSVLALLQWATQAESRTEVNETADLLRQQMQKPKNREYLYMYFDPMLELCERLPTADAQELAEMFVRLAGIEGDIDAGKIGISVPAVCLLHRWLKPDTSTRLRSKGTDACTSNLSKLSDTDRDTVAAEGLVEICKTRPALEADSTLRKALSRQTSPTLRRVLTQGLARCTPRPASLEETVDFVDSLADYVEIGASAYSFTDIPHALEALCVGLTREELHRRKAFPAVSSGLVPPDSLPKPKPLPPQVLVDLLKRPFVVREKQRAVLNALEITYDRKFKDLWEFVAFAEEEHPELDLLTPPKRPQVK